MKRLIVLAAVAALMIAGPASAQWGRHAVAQPNATFAFGAAGVASGPTTTNNDDTCDIGVTPAATLLLPYFEIETSGRATTTFFTITNTSAIPQIAHVTIWTDWSYPVLDFNIFLTGYDVQAIDLYDIIVNGVIAPGTGTGGTGVGTGAGYGNTVDGKTDGGAGTAYNGNNMTGNPNFSPVVIDASSTANCLQLPGALRPELVTAIRSALVTGTGYNGTGFGCAAADKVGSASSTHTTSTTAVGYVTVDVAAACNQMLPTETLYYTSSIGILYDNVLTGDYEIINKAAGSNYAGGNPLVHIRAIPEGGPANSRPTNGTNLPYTFYSRYINSDVNVNLDRRQPLPSVFAARWIQGGALALNTNFRIWREGATGANAVSPAGATMTYNTLTTCTTSSNNSALNIAEIVRFDEHENFLTNAPTGCRTSPCPASNPVSLPETSNRAVSDTSIYPPANFTSGDVGGWMYLNLNNGVAALTRANATSRSMAPTTRASQNWVVVAMSGTGSAAGQYGVDFDATWLGNGCSGAVPLSTLQTGGTSTIGPVGGVPVCPAGVNCGEGYPGTNVTP